MRGPPSITPSPPPGQNIVRKPQKFFLAPDNTMSVQGPKMATKRAYWRASTPANKTIAINTIRAKNEQRRVWHSNKFIIFALQKQHFLNGFSYEQHNKKQTHTIYPRILCNATHCQGLVVWIVFQKRGICRKRCRYNGQL